MKSEREQWYPLKVLVFTAGYLSYAVSKGLFILCALPLVVLLAPFPAAKRRVLQFLIYRYLGFFTRRWLPLLGAYRLAEISGLHHISTSKPVVLVANHRGFMDGLLILGLVPRTGIVSRVRDTRHPTYALLERHFDLVAVDRSSTDSVGGFVERCRAILQGGRNLLMFPEGTRARSGRLQHFTRTAFQLALATGVPVQPVVVHSTLPFMAKIPGSICPRGRNVFRIRFLEPEPARPGDDADALGERVYRRMARELKGLDAGTFWETGVRPGPAQDSPVRPDDGTRASVGKLLPATDQRT